MYITFQGLTLLNGDVLATPLLYVCVNSLSCMLFSQLPEEDYQSIIETLQ